MPLELHPPSTEFIDSHLADQKGVRLAVLRLDKMHPELGGNKWFKLKYNLEEAKRKNCTTLISFGGAHSNHLAALASAGNVFGFETIGIVRGEDQRETPTLLRAAQNGMKFEFLSRTAFSELKDNPDYRQQLNDHYPSAFIIPEGGKNNNGIRGSLEIAGKSSEAFDTVMLACGTGTTLAGVALSIGGNRRVIGITVSAKAEYLQEEIDRMISGYLFSGMPSAGDAGAWMLNHDYNFGGFAQTNTDLLQFKDPFESAYGIPLDYVYTSKLFYAATDLIEKNFFSPGERILLIHTGGLQGNAAMEARLRKAIKTKSRR